MNDMRAIGCAFRGLARMLLGYLQKKRQLKNRQREGTFKCQPAFNSSRRQAVSPVWHCAFPHLCGAQWTLMLDFGFACKGEGNEGCGRA
jgi:hypothetical protein